LILIRPQARAHVFRDDSSISSATDKHDIFSDFARIYKFPGTDTALKAVTISLRRKTTAQLT
jgi:hypothetical protein